MTTPAMAATDSFAAWALKNGKVYKTREELVLRRNIFAANVAKVEKHNSEATRGPWA